MEKKSNKLRIILEKMKEFYGSGIRFSISNFISIFLFGIRIMLYATTNTGGFENGWLIPNDPNDTAEIALLILIYIAFINSIIFFLNIVYIKIKSFFINKKNR